MYIPQREDLPLSNHDPVNIRQELFISPALLVLGM